MKETVHLPVSIPARPYLLDHRFEGRAVLPAVEAMRILSASVKEFAPWMDVSTILDAGFDKFLVIPGDGGGIEARCGVTLFESGQIEAVLQTKIHLQKAGFTRVKEHARATFRPKDQGAGTDAVPLPELRGERGMSVTRGQIYDELVPFGPAFQNINPDMKVCKKGAVATVLVPDAIDTGREASALGSPFVLDAAFHAACVWGQRYCGLVAFPISIDSRVVVKPTRRGCRYSVVVFHRQVSADDLFFDLDIFSDEGLCEMVRGLHMRDVSGGRMQPPEWIRTA